MKKIFTSFLLWTFTALSFSASAQNTALGFDGTSNYVTTPSSLVPAGADFTVEFWALTPGPTLSAGLHEFVSQGTLGSNAFYIGFDGTTGNINAGDVWPNTTVPMPVDRWVHIALTVSGTTATLYLDGVQKATNASYTVAAGAASFKMGAQTDNLSLMKGEMDELRVWNLARTAGEIKSGLYGNVATGTAGLVAYYKMNDASGTIVTNSTATAGLNGTWVGTALWPNSPVQIGSNAINFNGVNGQVAIPANSAYDLVSGTIECWVNMDPAANPSVDADIIGNRGAGGTRFSFHMSPIRFGLYNGGSFQTWPYTITLGTWYHLAFVCDGAQTTLYVNGVSQGAVPGGFGGSTLQPLTLGMTKSASPDGEAFLGSLDEVRIWSTQRTPTEITNTMHMSLSGNETGLLALFGFNQGIANGTNSFLTTVIDNTPNNNHGTLTNFAMTGTTSNFVPSSPVTLPVNFTKFTVTAQKDQAILQWQTAQEQNSREFVIERSSDGVSYHAIGSVPAAGNSNLLLDYSYTDIAPANGKNYYRLKETDLDSRFMYSVVKTVDFSFGGGQRLTWFKTGDKAVEVNLKNGNSEVYTVTDMNGRTVQQGRLSSGKLYLNQLSGGTYFVRVRADAGQQLDTKVLIQ